MEYNLSELSNFITQEYPHAFGRSEDITLTDLSDPTKSNEAVKVHVILDMKDNLQMISISCLELNDFIYAGINTIVDHCLSRKNDVEIINVQNSYNSKDLIFTQKVYISTNRILLTNKQSLVMLGNLKLEVRDQNYRDMIQNSRKNDIFLCHDSNDKFFVKKLYNELKKLNLKVWYDESSIIPGESSSEAINRGINNSVHCVAILSKNFISREKWASRYELTAFTEKEMATKQVIIPVWLDIEVFDLTRTGNWWLQNKSAIIKKGNTIKQVAVKIKNAMVHHKTISIQNT